MVIYYLIFLFLIILFIYNEFQSGLEKLLLFLVATIFTIFAGIKELNVSHDGMNYAYMFDRVNFYSDYFNNYYDVMTILIAVTLKYLNLYSYLLIFIIFAVLGVFLKIKAISKYSVLPLFSCIFYFIHFYLLHEMTQIRVGVATAILLLSVSDIYDKNFLKFLFKVFWAFLFHSSALVFIPFYFINTKKINARLYLIGLIFAITFSFIGINIFYMTPILSSISNKLYIYQALQNTMQELNLFNVNNIFYILLFLILLFFSKTLLEINKYSIIMLKMLYFSFISLFVLSKIPVFAWRISEIFMVSSFIVISYIPFLIKPKWFSIIMLILVATLFLTLNLFRQHLVYQYHIL